MIFPARNPERQRGDKDGAAYRKIELISQSQGATCKINLRGKTIADLGFDGFVVHEYSPVRDPKTALQQAIEIFGSGGLIEIALSQPPTPPDVRFSASGG
ncbi:MAG: hypothetical protein M3Y57_10155 [Acidobacteriota bacterium]|nr:hypothetical protein [Acidobacteriota bacterium]